MCVFVLIRGLYIYNICTFEPRQKGGTGDLPPFMFVYLLLYLTFELRQEGYGGLPPFMFHNSDV